MTNALEKNETYHRIAAVYAIGGCVAANMVVDFVYSKKNLVQGFFNVVQRHRSFFSLFSLKKHHEWEGYMIAMVSLYLNNYALDYCENRSRNDLLTSFGIIYTKYKNEALKGFIKIYHRAFRISLYNRLRNKEKMSEKYVDLVFYILSKLPETGTNFVQGFNKIMLMTSKGEGENFANLKQKADYAFLSIKDIADFRLTACISLITNKMLSDEFEFARSLAEGEVSKEERWLFAFTPPLPN